MKRLRLFLSVRGFEDNPVLGDGEENMLIELESALLGVLRLDIRPPIALRAPAIKPPCRWGT
jgi:hypothetical protein